MSLVPYAKTASSIAQQLQKLTQRGLAIPDPALAEHYLKYIGYYRLTGYGLSFFDRSTNQYHAGKSFQDLLDHYTFDRELRVHVMDEIERIEIAVRTVIVNELSLQHGPHWYLNYKIFNQKKDALIFGDLVRKVETDTGRSKELFIYHYHKKYNDPYLPPAWMAAECLSFGVWSRIYAALLRPDRIRIANNFGLLDEEMGSFIHSLTVVRNACAHHARVFDRRFSHQPKTVGKLSGLYTQQDQGSFYARAALIQAFLSVILPVNHWPAKLSSLFRKYPTVRPVSLKFPVGWETLPFWTAQTPAAPVVPPAAPTATPHTPSVASSGAAIGSATP